MAIYTDRFTGSLHVRLVDSYLEPLIVLDEHGRHLPMGIQAQQQQQEGV